MKVDREQSEDVHDHRVQREVKTRGEEVAKHDHFIKFRAGRALIRRWGSHLAAIDKPLEGSSPPGLRGSCGYSPELVWAEASQSSGAPCLCAKPSRRKNEDRECEGINKS